MVQPTKRQIEADPNQIPTTLPGLVFLLVKLFGPWSLMAVFLAVVWWSSENKAARWEQLLKESISNTAASTQVMKDLSTELRANTATTKDGISDMRNATTTMTDALRRIESTISRAQSPTP